MDTYIDRQGNIINQEQPIKIGHDSIVKVFRVLVLKEWAGAPDECKGIEMFCTFPTHNQILWAIKKHDGDMAKIEKLYKNQEEIPF